jgi:lipopolysaccharide biosynthesis glycosyltransferase
MIQSPCYRKIIQNNVYFSNRMIKSWIKYFLFSVFIHIVPSYKNNTINDVGMVTLLCHEHVGFYIFCLTSFFYTTGLQLPVYILDDGSLTKDDISLLNSHFNVMIETRESCDAKLKQQAKKYPFVYNQIFGSNVHHMMFRKIIAILASPYPRCIYTDSDLLFLKRPTEIRDWIIQKQTAFLYTAHNCEREYKNTYPLVFYIEHNFRKLLKKVTKIDFDTSFNSGLLCIPDTSHFNFSRCNTCVKILFKNYVNEIITMDEITLSVLFANTHAVRLPTETYRVAPFLVDYKKTEQTICIHYAAESKIHFVPDAVKLAIQTKLFGSLVMSKN